MNFISLWKDGTSVFVNVEQIQRISFGRKDGLKESEREVKIQFIDGSTGTYVGHRNIIKALGTFDVLRVLGSKKADGEDE